MKDFNRFMYDHSLHCRREHLLSLLLTRFHYRGSLKRHIKDCFKITVKKRLRCLRKVNILNSKILKEK